MQWTMCFMRAVSVSYLEERSDNQKANAQGVCACAVPVSIMLAVKTFGGCVPAGPMEKMCFTKLSRMFLVK